MPEDISKELLMLGGTIAGFIAALLTVMEKLIDIQHRMGSRKDRKSLVQQERQTQESAPSVDFFSTKPFRGTSYLLMYETGVIVAAPWAGTTTPSAPAPSALRQTAPRL